MAQKEKKEEVRIVVPGGQVVLRAIDAGVVAIVPEGYEGYLIRKAEPFFGPPYYEVIPFEKSVTEIRKPEEYKKIETTEPEALIPPEAVKVMEKFGKEVAKGLRVGWERLKEILRKRARGEELTPEEEARLKEAFEEVGIPVVE